MGPQVTLPRFLREPLFFFSILLFANAILAYLPLPALAGLWVALLGVVLPLAGAHYSLKDRKIPPGFTPMGWEGVRPLPWTWGPVFLLAVGLRFYRLTDLNAWPTRDDGYFIYQAMDLERNGTTPFFYGIGEMPPVFREVLAPFLRWTGPSLSALWSFPALLSLFAFLAGCWAVRRSASRAFTWVFGVLLASSFWVLCLGRFCNVWGLLFLWEWVTWGVLAGWFLSTDFRTRLWALGAGAALGAGFYISPTHWSFLALAVTLWLLGWSARKPGRWGSFFLYLLSASIVFLPFGAQALTQHYGRHVHEVWQGVVGLLSPSHLFRSAGYVTGIFWGSPTYGFNYGPVWGGFLNPVLGSSFLFGVLYLLRNPKPLSLRWSVLVFLILLAPGFLTHDLEMQRVLLVLPLLLLGAAYGAVFLTTMVPSRWRMPFLGCLLVLSVGLDLYQLAVPLPRALDPQSGLPQGQSVESYRAYQILKEKAARQGPGLIFLDLVSVPLDQTLLVASYPFNAAVNPALAAAQPRWMAFLANVNYRPFLEKRFPPAEWSVVGSKLLPWDGELMLGIVPLDPKDRDTAGQWVECRSAFEAMTAGISRLPEGRSRGTILGDFLKAAPKVHGDPFLESSFWEIAYFNHSADKDLEAARRDLEMVLKQGYPAAHIYNELGGLLFFERKYPEAKKAFEKAVQLGGAHTPAAENLRLLEAGHS